MKLNLYRLWTHPEARMEQTGWTVLLITCKGIQNHGIHYAYAFDPTHLEYSPKQTEKVSLSGAKHVFWKVDAHGSSTHSDISTETMHQYVFGPTVVKMIMHSFQMSWTREPYQFTRMQQRQGFTFGSMSPLSAWTPSWMMKLGIGSPPSTITRISKI